MLLVTDPIATLVHSENQFWFCIGEVNELKIDGKTVGYICLDISDWKSGPCNRKKTANRTDLDRFGPDRQLPVAYVSD